MHTMHEMGILHRDVSADNIMIEGGYFRIASVANKLFCTYIDKNGSFHLVQILGRYVFDLSEFDEFKAVTGCLHPEDNSSDYWRVTEK